VQLSAESFNSLHAHLSKADFLSMLLAVVTRVMLAQSPFGVSAPDGARTQQS
jgi:hypothetical protein